MDKHILFITIVGFFAFYVCVKMWVSFRQIEFLQNFKPQDDGFDVKELEESRKYALAKEKFAILTHAVEFFVFCFWAFVGISILSSLLTNDSKLYQALGIAAFLAIGFLLELPLSILSTFGLDKKFGFTATTPSLFASDKLKELALTLILGTVMSLAAIYFVSYFENWWVMVFATLAIFIIGANILYPNFIAPLFHKFEKLENDEITSGLRELATKSGFNLEEIYKVDAGKRDTRLNAYFAGLGRTKRVTFYDTLLAKLSKEEIFAVCAHELGHFKHKHLIGSMGMMLFVFFIACFTLGKLDNSFFESLGLAKSGAGVVIVFMLFSPLFLYVFMPLVNFIYKKNEYEADAYAAKMGLKASMINALSALAKENKAFPYASKTKIFFDYTHPPITARLERLKKLS
ncbi:MAG: M48 family metallopeptidase [Campylobacterales bacterium]|nr:M48 family metallopeptidase [Campylobacterales bacterium]